jgi:hypothetical protein
MVHLADAGSAIIDGEVVVPAVIEILGVWLQGRGLGERPFGFAKLTQQGAEIQSTSQASSRS